MEDTSTPEASITDLLSRIRAEYLEIPGLNLTRQQVERCWGLDELMCQSLLDALVDAHFLMLTRSGQYARAQVDPQ